MAAIFEFLALYIALYLARYQDRQYTDRIIPLSARKNRHTTGGEAMPFAALFQGTAAPEHLETLKKLQATLARESMEEPGTVRYEFYQAADDPTHILLFAIWESEADWQAHRTGDVHNRYVASLPEGVWTNRPQMTRLQALEASRP